MCQVFPMRCMGSTEEDTCAKEERKPESWDVGPWVVQRARARQKDLPTPSPLNHPGSLLTQAADGRAFPLFSPGLLPLLQLGDEFWFRKRNACSEEKRTRWLQVILHSEPHQGGGFLKVVGKM